MSQFPGNGKFEVIFHYIGLTDLIVYVLTAPSIGERSNYYLFTKKVLKLLQTIKTAPSNGEMVVFSIRYPYRSYLGT